MAISLLHVLPDLPNPVISVLISLLLNSRSLFNLPSSQLNFKSITCNNSETFFVEGGKIIDPRVGGMYTQPVNYVYPMSQHIIKCTRPSVLFLLLTSLACITEDTERRGLGMRATGIPQEKLCILHCLN